MTDEKKVFDAMVAATRVFKRLEALEVAVDAESLEPYPMPDPTLSRAKEVRAAYKACNNDNIALRKVLTQRRAENDKLVHENERLRKELKAAQDATTTGDAVGGWSYYSDRPPQYKCPRCGTKTQAPLPQPLI